MMCIHCNEPGAHPGTRKCTDLHACHGRQEYARGVEDERARVVADLRAMLFRQAMAQVSDLADRYERREHEEGK